MPGPDQTDLVLAEVSVEGRAIAGGGAGMGQITPIRLDPGGQTADLGGGARLERIVVEPPELPVASPTAW